jgi:ADP-ribose pyrophosphatase YjhB (NUDIX family)
LSAETPPAWLAWTRELQAIAQTGLAFATGDYDRQRYRRLAGIAAEIAAAPAGLSAADLAEVFLAHPGYATPKVDVRGAIVRDGRVLLVQEASDGRWCLPGGWADVGELPSAMVAREVREESGLEVAARRLIAVFDANRSGRPLDLFHAYKLVFLCDVLGGEPRAGDETTDARWFGFDDLPPLSSARTSERHLAEVRAHVANPARPAFFD